MIASSALTAVAMGLVVHPPAAPLLQYPPSAATYGCSRCSQATFICRLQVVTDIDDTIKSSGGVALAGIPLGGVDVSYQRGSIYPGVFHFAAALAAQSMMGPPAPVAVLTARAEEVSCATCSSPCSLSLSPSLPLPPSLPLSPSLPPFLVV